MTDHRCLCEHGRDEHIADAICTRCWCWEFTPESVRTRIWRGRKNTKAS
jgi:hypothetical protein